MTVSRTFDCEEYRTWVASVTHEITGDPLWRMSVYRLALFALDLAWQDAKALDRGITRSAAAQLYTAVASISANIADAYGRQSGRDRARFYEYALCSARESLVWYRAGRRALGAEVVSKRNETLEEIRRLLLVIAPAERERPTIRRDLNP
jgi:four helix bundle protein